MSDRIPPEVVAEVQRRDQRFRDIALGVQIESQLRENQPLFMLMTALREDADRAMQEFANANCGDTNLIQGLQSRVFRFTYALETFDAILSRGRAAESAVMAEDQAERERRDDGA